MEKLRQLSVRLLTRIKKLPRHQRRALLIACGLLLGFLCRFVPAEYQSPCSAVAKVVSLFLGA